MAVAGTVVALATRPRAIEPSRAAQILGLQSRQPVPDNDDAGHDHAFVPYEPISHCHQVWFGAFGIDAQIDRQCRNGRRGRTEMAV